MENVELNKNEAGKNAIDYSEFLLQVSELWREVNQRDDTKTILYNTMDTMMGADRYDHRTYKMWFSDPQKWIIDTNKTPENTQFIAWVMISALQKATLTMINRYADTLLDAQTKLNRATTQLIGMEKVLRTLTPNTPDNHGN